MCVHYIQSEKQHIKCNNAISITTLWIIKVYIISTGNIEMYENSTNEWKTTSKADSVPHLNIDEEIDAKVTKVYIQFNAKKKRSLVNAIPLTSTTIHREMMTYQLFRKRNRSMEISMVTDNPAHLWNVHNLSQQCFSWMSHGPTTFCRN